MEFVESLFQDLFSHIMKVTKNTQRNQINIGVYMMIIGNIFFRQSRENPRLEIDFFAGYNSADRD